MIVFPPHSPWFPQLCCSAVLRARRVRLSGPNERYSAQAFCAKPFSSGFPKPALRSPGSCPGLLLLTRRRSCRRPHKEADICSHHALHSSPHECQKRATRAYFSSSFSLPWHTWRNAVHIQPDIPTGLVTSPPPAYWPSGIHRCKSCCKQLEDKLSLANNNEVLRQIPS